MAAERLHHNSKKNRFTVVLVPDEDAGKAKNFRFAPWHLVTGLIAYAAAAVTVVLLLLIYTPLGGFFPLANPGLEIKYGKELLLLNQRMNNLMEQLVELRSYNVKLRRAMGERVTVNDSGTVALEPRAEEREKSRIQNDNPSSSVQAYVNTEQEMPPSRPAIQEPGGSGAVSFPAILPTEGYVTRGFEPSHNHYGMDIAGKTGNLIVAAADGNVVFSGWTYEYGYVVIVAHSSGFTSFYKHNQALLKSSGAFVRRGEPIATLGNSGITSSGPHLHFEIWKDGVPVDPTIYMINFYL